MTRRHGPRPPRIVYGCRNQSDFEAFVSRHRRLLSHIEAYEDGTPTEDSYLHRGWCAVCRGERDFLVDYGYSWTDTAGKRRRNWRERLECQGCHLNNRMRSAVQLLLGNLTAGEGGRVYLTEQITPLYAALKGRITDLIGSEFLRDGTARGACNAAGIRHEDLTALSFPSGTFRCIGSFDVLEHVPDFRRGLAELLRCLEPAGWLLLSTPIFLHYDRTLVRARLDPHGTVQHLHEPEIHGDPLSGDGALCFYHFGWSLLDDLRDVGFYDPKVLLFWSRRNAHLGGLQPIILAQKPARMPADPPARHPA